MTHPVKATGTQELARFAESTKKYVQASKAPGTRRTYRSAWADFKKFCREHHVEALPASPETVAAYLTALADERHEKVATLQRKAAAIAFAHRAAKLESPTRSILVQTTLSGIRRTLGVAQRQKQPVTVAELRAMCDALPKTLAGARDHLILTLGFAGCLRRSEIVALDFPAHIRRTEEGLVIHIASSKTDAERAGADIGIPYGSNRLTCPVRSYEAYIAASGITSGPLFRPVAKGGRRLLPGRLGDRSVALVVKAALERIGKRSDEYGGHSLRAGLITAAALAGVQERVIAEQSRHKSMIVLRRYIRKGSLFRENAASMVGL